MEKLIIEGGISLNGTLRVNGSKNASLPILFGAILADSEVTYTNVPYLRDISTTLKLLNILSCPAERKEDGSIVVKPGSLSPEAPYDLVKTMRASVLVLGPLLARLGCAKVALPGGCAIGARPVDQHLKAMGKMGAVFDLEDGYIIGRCGDLRGADITFDMPTVGGTENVLMAAALAKGKTTLRNAAREPEITDLANFLNACGAKITGQGTDVLHIQGVPSLSGATYRVMPDRIEAGTFLVAGAITGGEVFVEDCPFDELMATIAKLSDMGVLIQKRENGVLVKCNGYLKGVDIVTRPHPGFPTDMQAQLIALMTLASGSSSVEETIFENRFMHVPELTRMGADIKVSGGKAFVRGIKRLTGAPVIASDLRASASLVLAGLAATGKTEVQRIYHLDRGYEKIEERLNAVGARIRRVAE
jgi:UDP-N-acetylglucosamine 1-carboxyvinyltransferase